jgi:hypothetical protein
VRRSSENSFGESGEVDLLSEAISVFREEGVGGNVTGEDIVRSQVTTVESKEKVAEPSIVLNKGFENRV